MQEVFDLISPVPADMARYLPHLSYYLLDIRRLPEAQLRSLRNAAACVFRIDSSDDLEEGLAALAELPELLPGPEHEALRADVMRWILEMVLPSRLTGVNFPQVTRLEEVVEMLTANAPDWTARWRNEGRRQGLREGEAALLLRLLTRRFGALSPEVRRRIDSADAEQLLEWGERFVSARSPEEVFGTQE